MDLAHEGRLPETFGGWRKVRSLRVWLVTTSRAASGLRPTGITTRVRGARWTAQASVGLSSQARPGADKCRGGAPRGVRASHSARHASQGVVDLVLRLSALRPPRHARGDQRNRAVPGAPNPGRRSVGWGCLTGKKEGRLEAGCCSWRLDAPLLSDCMPEKPGEPRLSLSVSRGFVPLPVSRGKGKCGAASNPGSSACAGKAGLRIFEADGTHLGNWTAGTTTTRPALSPASRSFPMYGSARSIVRPQEPVPIGDLSLPPAALTGRPEGQLARAVAEALFAAPSRPETPAGSLYAAHARSRLTLSLGGLAALLRRYRHA
jgi:hypothetical protein